MRIILNFVFLFMAAALLPGCNNDSASVSAIRRVNDGFQTDTVYAAALAGYSTALVPADSTLKLSRRLLPTGLDTTSYALMVTSVNKDNSMFTYLSRKLTGLRPSTDYRISIDIGLGTNYPQNIPAGSAVYLKAGAANIAPATDATTFAFNLDKGTGNTDGRQMVVTGNVSNDQNRAGYALVTRSTAGKTVDVRSDANGAIWLCVGYESQYKGTTQLFFDYINATIRQN